MKFLNKSHLSIIRCHLFFTRNVLLCVVGRGKCNKMPAGAVYSKKPSGVKPCLLLPYPNRPHQTGLMWDGLQTIEIRPLWIRWRSGEPEQMGILREMGILPREIHWHNYYSEKEYYAAIVEERY